MTPAAHAGTEAREMDGFQREVGEWADRTFPRSTPESVTSHLQEEARELRDVAHAYPATGNVTPLQMREEAADCLLLLMHLAHKMGFDLMAAARAKHGINTKRVWEADDGGKGYWKHLDPAPRATQHVAKGEIVLLAKNETAPALPGGPERGEEGGG